MGMVKLYPDRAGIEDLLAMTHHALYRSKAGGKNRLSREWEAGGMGLVWPSVSDVVETLRQGARLIVVRQSIRRLSDQAPVGCEYSCRLDLPEYEGPDDFFRIASKAGILALVDHHCFRACLASASQGDPLTSIHINLFSSSLPSTRPQALMNRIWGRNLRRRLVVVVEETRRLLPSREWEHCVLAFKRMGARVALGGVGFGRGTLDCLLSMEPDLIKLDRRAILGVAGHASRRAPLERLLKTLRGLSIPVLAEGVENEADYRVLRDMGVALGQGYYWDRPA